MDIARLREITGVLASYALAFEQRMRAHHHRAAMALGVTVEQGSELWGWAGRSLGAPARTAAGTAAWCAQRGG